LQDILDGRENIPSPCTCSNLWLDGPLDRKWMSISNKLGKNIHYTVRANMQDRHSRKRWRKITQQGKIGETHWGLGDIIWGNANKSLLNMNLVLFRVFQLLVSMKKKKKPLYPAW
jgi:hypothetical protein